MVVRNPPILDLPMGVAPAPLGGSFHAGDWDILRSQINRIELRHQDDDEETPRLSSAVLQGTWLLLRALEGRAEKLPTVMTGTCDATIVLEWHAPDGGRAFRSLDLLSENEAEEFVTDEQGRNELRKVRF